MRRSPFTILLNLVGLIGLVFFTGVSAGFAQPETAYVRVVRAFELEEMNLSNPAGLAYAPGSNAFHVVEARLKGQPPSTVTAIIKLTPFNERVGLARIAEAITDPINLAVDGQRGRLLIFQSAANQLLEVAVGPDGNLEAGQPIRHNVRHFGLRNAQGMTVDPVSGELFFLDGEGPRIVRVVPAADGSFGGAQISRVDLGSSGLVDAVGVALDPSSGDLHVVDRASQQLYELSRSGEVLATRDLSGFGISDPQGMVFAPSGDLTDDPGQMHLYLVDRGLAAGPQLSGSQDADLYAAASGTGQILEMSFVEPPSVAASTFVSSLIQTINAFQWSPPSPDSSGVVYLPASNSLMVSDGEVNEMPIYAGANVFESTLTGTLIDTFTTLDFGNNEPTGITVNPANGHLFISQDTPPKAIYELDPGPDGDYDTTDDIVTSFVTADFGATDPEGVSYATGLGHLFIADGLNNEVYQLAPGPNGVFDGVPPAGDDQVVGQFDTFSNGMEDPEGVAYNPDTGNLYIAGKTRNIGSHNFDTLLEVTTSGVLVQYIDVSAANPGRIYPKQKLSGLAYGPSSGNPSQDVIYIADRGEDNNNDPNENDGRVYEMSLPAAPGNAPPVAVDDTAVTSQDTAVTVDVAFNDSDPDGNLDPASANTTCATCSDPGNGTLVNIGNGTFDYTPNPSFTGSDSFVYEICDTGDDGNGSTNGDDLCDTATVNITVTVPNDPPVANDDNFSVDEDSTISGNVLADNGNGADSDPDGNLDPNSVTLVSGPTNGTLTTFSSNGNFAYDPNADYNGPDSFVYQVCDLLGLCDTATVSITVNPIADPPVANGDSASTGEATPVVIDVAANDTDPDGNLAPNSANHTCANGSAGCAGASSGSLTSNGDGTITYTPNSGFTGSDSFVYEICDLGGLCATATVTVSVSGDQIIYVSSNSGGNVGGVAFKDEDILAFDTGTGTWAMYFDGSDVGLGASGQEIDGFHINPDGSILLSLGVAGTLPNVGSVDDFDILRFIPTSTGDVTAGTYELYLNGEDFGLSASGEDIDALTFAPDGRLVISTRGTYSAGGISGGDEDLIKLLDSGLWELYFDGSAVALDASSEDVAGTWIDANGDVYLSVRGTFSVNGLAGDGADIILCEPLSTGPITSCTFSMHWDGSDPANGFGGEVLNGFFLSGGSGGQVNAPPVAVADSAVTSQDTVVTVDVAANDSDPDGNLDPASANTTCATCSDPGNGTLVNNGNGTFDYTPNPSFTGSDSFVYEICDTGDDGNGSTNGDDLCDTATVNITVTVPNDPPVANNDSAATNEDVSVVIDVAGNDTDPDGNLASNSANHTCANGSTGCAGAANGTLTTNGDGTISYAPNQDYNGVDSFVYEICDVLGLCATAMVSITVNPIADPPVANDDSASTGEATPVVIDVAGNDTDPDGDLNPASANTSCATCTGPTNGTLVNNGNGTFDYTPDAGFTGSDSFVYEICDLGGLCATASVTVSVSGDQILYLSSTSGGNVGGVAFKDEDILTFDTGTGTWAMYFDGSDVGLGGSGQEIDAYHIDPNGSILLSLGADGTIPDVGSVDDSDIVRFTPTSLGDNTAGTFEVYFDGSDVDLSTSGEDIDALTFAPDGRLVISTRGSFGVTGVSGKDEDLIIFTATSLGPTTSGTWAMYFDGTDVGLDSSSEDVAGTWIDASGDIYLTVRGAFTVGVNNDVSGDAADIFVCIPGSTGDNTSCTFSLFWDGSANGFGGEVNNGLFIGP